MRWVLFFLLFAITIWLLATLASYVLPYLVTFPLEEKVRVYRESVRPEDQQNIVLAFEGSEIPGMHIEEAIYSIGRESNFARYVVTCQKESFDSLRSELGEDVFVDISDEVADRRVELSASWMRKGFREFPTEMRIARIEHVIEREEGAPLILNTYVFWKEEEKEMVRIWLRTYPLDYLINFQDYQ